MSLDKVLMIPHLSKELDLIGQTILPYDIVHEKIANKKSSDDYEAMKIVFDSKKMIDTLISVCFELVKQIKVLGFNNEDSELDKVKFENIKLQKQLKLINTEHEKNLDTLAAEKEKNTQLKTKIDQLEAQVKNYEINMKKFSKQNSTNEDILKHNLKKKESDLEELHKIIWKQFNLADRNFFPKNFEIISLNQPDFNKLWSEVKYSSPKTKEEALKKAVCKFQENNQILMENNFLLKSVLLVTMKKISEIYNESFEKFLFSEISFSKFNINEIFENLNTINLPKYEQFLNDHLNFFKKICELFEEAKFSVSDDLFVCWSDVIKKLKQWLYENSA